MHLHADSGVTSIVEFVSVKTDLVLYFQQSIYHQAILPLVIITLVLAWQARPCTSEELSVEFRKFRCQYLSVWIPCVAADWLQGPYVYALYEAYGFHRTQIAQLFVMGFFSAMVCSSFIGALVDRFGRKKFALAYCALYILSCLTMHFKSYGVLMFGRIIGGMATSLLFSCFECWMVSEHLGRHKFSSSLLSYMFGLMFMIMYLVAIVCGLMGEAVSRSVSFKSQSEESSFHWGGYTGPFDLAILCNVVGFIMIAIMWNENYGALDDETKTAHMVSNFNEAIRFMKTDTRAWILCIIVACFEGVMYTFTFSWTPALASPEVPPPYGVIFSLFMMACTCGSCVATAIATRVQPVNRLMISFMVGALALLACATITGPSQLPVCFFGFIIFEFCVGLYFPSVGILKSEVVPEHVRGTVYNIYRVPLNVLVVALLLTDMSIPLVLAYCSMLLGGAFVLTSLAGSMKLPDKTVQDTLKMV